MDSCVPCAEGRHDACHRFDAIGVELGDDCGCPCGDGMVVTEEPS